MLFSIIVPVYNIAKYLDECISSVLGQDYDDYELILIDDGSTDSSGEICDKYALENSRVCVIHKQNEGLSIARNCGINEAHGEFIIFLDGDDYLASSMMLSELSAYIAKNNFDVIVYDGKIFWQDGGRKVLSDKTINKLAVKDSYSFDTFIKFYLCQRDLWGWYAWLYVVRKSIFVDANLYFPRQRMYEDAYLTWRLLANAKKIGTTSKLYYMYRQGREGAITNTKTHKSIIDFIWVIENNLRDIKCMNIEESVKELLMGNFSNGYFTCLVMAGMLQKQEKKNCIKELEKKKYLMNYALLPRYRYAAKLAKVLGIKNTIEILALRYRWKMGIKIWRLRDK